MSSNENDARKIFVKLVVIGDSDGGQEAGQGEGVGARSRLTPSNYLTEVAVLSQDKETPCKGRCC